MTSTGAAGKDVSRMSVDYKSIGARIQYYRSLQGVSQESLAEAVAVSRRYISDLELGKKGASLETLVAIANTLRITAGDILADILIEERPSVLSANFDIFGDCTREETDFLLAMLQSTKQIIRKYRLSK